LSAAAQHERLAGGYGQTASPMLEDNIDCDEIGYRSFEPEKNKIVCIYKVVKDLKRRVTPFSYSLKDEFQLGTIAGVYRYIQVTGQFVW
jgi:hypothetical protein